MAVTKKVEEKLEPVVAQRIVKPAPIPEALLGVTEPSTKKYEAAPRHVAYDNAAIELPEERPVVAGPKSIHDIVSPLMRDDPNGGLRVRKGWHQTWKRNDEFEAARDVGYKVIRKQAKGETKLPGFETGDVLTRTEDDGTIIAMEVPEWVYEDHILAISSQSHRLYNDPATVLKGFQDKTGRDLTSKHERISLTVDYEGQTETLKR